jgi:hypothetical protein
MIFLLGFILTSCKKDSTNQENQFEAKVLGKNEDCELYAIQFTNNIQKANEIAGTLVTEYVFIADNLPKDLQVDGLLIILNIRRIQASELGACTTRGFSYPWIYVMDAKKKD